MAGEIRVRVCREEAMIVGLNLKTYRRDREAGGEPYTAKRFQEVFEGRLKFDEYLHQTNPALARPMTTINLIRLQRLFTR